MRRSFLLILLNLTSCAFFPDSPEELYKEFTGDKPQKEMLNFLGYGRLAIPSFMSKGIFFYNYEAKTSHHDFVANNFPNHSLQKAKKTPALSLDFWEELISTEQIQNTTSFINNKAHILLKFTHQEYINEVFIDTSQRKIVQLSYGIYE